MGLQKRRLEYKPRVPEILRDLRRVVLVAGKKREASQKLREWFPRTFERTERVLERGEGKRGALSVGVVFSGGQAAGGHNVVTGLWDGLREIDGKSRLFGFLNGPSGIVENQWKELDGKSVDAVRNQGGFDLLGSGRTKIETAEQMAAAMKVCLELHLDGLVVVGGDDSNTNAAMLAEYFLEKGCKTAVVGVPKTIDGDLRSEEIEISFGFDSATKTYAELIGNIARDALSAKKYYHFIKLMGRSASHVTLECALTTHPNLALIGEEKKGLEETVREIADLIERRKKASKEYGVILIPEGLVEFFPEMKELTHKGITEENRKFFESLPEKIQKQLTLEKDPHGNIAVSQIETEQLLIDLVKKKCAVKFSAQEHFFGYEGRACFPSNFDANYCYTLGLLAALGVRDGASGAICAVQHMAKPVAEWQVKMVPIVGLMHLEERKGKEKPVVKKALVDLKGKAFGEFKRFRKSWEMDDDYQYPGPIQFFGDGDLTDSVPLSL